MFRSYSVRKVNFLTFVFNELKLRFEALYQLYEIDIYQNRWSHNY